MRARTIAAAALMCLALVSWLTGCGPAREPEEGSATVYYVAEPGGDVSSAVAGEARALPRGEDAVSGTVSLLTTPPETPGLTSPYPEGTRVESWRLEGTTLYLDFNEPYGQLTGVGLTLADYCTVLTLTGLEEVEQVYITAAGEELPERAGQMLRAEDVLLYDQPQSPVVLRLYLWFPSEEGGLGSEYREIPVSEDTGRVMAIVGALCDGPESRGYLAFLPQSADGVSGWVEDGICYLNLPAAWVEFLSRPEAAVPRDTAFQAIAGAMVELEDVTRVQFLQEGEELSSWNATR